MPLKALLISFTNALLFVIKDYTSGLEAVQRLVTHLTRRLLGHHANEIRFAGTNHLATLTAAWGPAPVASLAGLDHVGVDLGNH